MTRRLLDVDKVRIAGVAACLPSAAEDNLARCTALYGDAARARNVVQTTGIRTRRVAAPSVSSLDLCTAAARRVLDVCGVSPSACGAVVAVTFTPERLMPGNACQAQTRLGLPTDALAFDVGLACSGYPYGLYLAGTLARATGRPALLLDGDVQTAVLDPQDGATVPVMADAGTATLVLPAPDAVRPWQFGFLTDGAAGAALSVPRGGTMTLDGFALFKFAAMDVSRFLCDFLAAASCPPAAVSAFVPNQSTLFTMRKLAQQLGIDAARLWISGDVFGNSASASVPVTIAHCAPAARTAEGWPNLLVAGFGGGLSASAARVDLRADCRFALFDHTTAEGEG